MDCRYRVVESSSIVSVLFREALSHPNIVSVLMTTPYLLDIGGWAGKFKWHTIRYRASKDLILVHTVQLKPIIKAQSSGKMDSSGISDVVIASVHSEKIV